MRQAIDEGFILNVLANYTTYKAYFKLIKRAEEDPQVQKRAATKALARYMGKNEHHIAQKVDVMIEHFWRHTRHKINGRQRLWSLPEAVWKRINTTEHFSERSRQGLRGRGTGRIFRRDRRSRHRSEMD